MPLLYAVSSTIYFGAYYLFRWKRALVTANLTRAFPHKSAAEIRAIERSHFKGLFDSAVETLKAKVLSSHEISRCVAFQNMKLIKNLSDKPFLLVSGHQGNWEWQMLALKEIMPVPLEAIYAPGPSAVLNEFLLSIRMRSGAIMIQPDQALVEIARRMQQPRGLILLADQNPRRDAERCWVHFFQQDTAFGVGLEKIARLTRYPKPLYG